MKAIHLGMTIRDTQKTLDFYCNVLGAELLWEPKRIQQGPQTDLIYGEAGVQVKVSGINLHGMIIEFFQFLSATVAENSYRTDYKTGGWKHLALEVEDIEHEVERLQKKGVYFRYPVQTIHTGARLTYFDDPDGVMFELIQYPQKDWLQQLK